MPFAVFRRHQRKLLAIFAILAMFGFVVADSLPRLLSGSSAAANPTVATLYGRTIRRGDIALMQTQRNNANLFLAELTAMFPPNRPIPNVFGDLNTRSIVDALILEHEADELGMPAGPEVGRQWLEKNFSSFMTRERFEAVLSRFNNRVTGKQILADIASQVRIRNVRFLLGAPVVTPLDVFRGYRDQNERVSARAVGFRVDDFLAQVSEPSDDQVRSHYEKYKDVLPDRESPTPGFKVPRQIQVEILTLDGQALANTLKEKLSEPELLSYYENRKTEFRRPSEFPDQIFEGDTKLELTPIQVQPFSEVRPYLATSLADERAQADIVARFERIKEDHMFPFANKVLDMIDEAEEKGKKEAAEELDLPKPESLETVAKKEGLQHEISPMLDRERAERFGLVSGAEVGMTRLSGGKKFAEEMFDTKSARFEPVELTDLTGHRFLVRKIQDVPPRVPPLDQIRAEVVRAWKLEQARPKAEEAARKYAEKVKEAGGKIVGEIVEGRPVFTTEPLAKLQPGPPLPGRFFENGPPVPADIPQMPSAGPELRDAFFGLAEGSVAVAPDQPRNVYYVLTLNRRLPATFATLYAPNGDYFRYRREALEDAGKSLDEAWMKELRAEAGLTDDWVPADEAPKG